MVKSEDNHENAELPQRPIYFWLKLLFRPVHPSHLMAIVFGVGLPIIKLIILYNIFQKAFCTFVTSFAFECIGLNPPIQGWCASKYKLQNNNSYFCTHRNKQKEDQILVFHTVFNGSHYSCESHRLLGESHRFGESHCTLYKFVLGGRFRKSELFSE